MKLNGRVVVVTGSTRGIGRAIAEACAKEGARVVICSRQKSAVSETLDTFKKEGWQVSGIGIDVSAKGDLEKLLQHAIETWGGIDVWINNAGLSGGFRPLQEMTQEEIRALVNVNFTAVLNACQLVIPYFITKGGGILINMNGKGGRGEPSPFLATYSATKAAVTNLTKSLAQENRAYPISVHSVIPGMVETDFYKDMKTSPELAPSMQSLPYVLKAFGVPTDVVGRFFVKIAAQEPGKVTGKTYSILGGWRLIRAILLMIWYRASGKIRKTV